MVHHTVNLLVLQVDLEEEVIIMNLEVLVIHLL
jgi:hypothetical protein